jgi:hypothetical protein
MIAHHFIKEKIQEENTWQASQLKAMTVFFYGLNIEE